MTTDIVNIDPQTQSFLDNIGELERRLVEATDQYERIEIRDMAQKAQVAAQLMERRDLVSKANRLVILAEFDFAQVPPTDSHESGSMSRGGRGAGVAPGQPQLINNDTASKIRDAYKGVASRDDLIYIMNEEMRRRTEAEDDLPVFTRRFFLNIDAWRETPEDRRRRWDLEQAINEERQRVEEDQKQQQEDQRQAQLNAIWQDSVRQHQRDRERTEKAEGAAAEAQRQQALAEQAQTNAEQRQKEEETRRQQAELAQATAERRQIEIDQARAESDRQRVIAEQAKADAEDRAAEYERKQQAEQDRIDADRAEREKRLADAQARREERETRQRSEGIRLYQSPISDLYELVPEGSVDVIITDPPYGDAFLPVYADLVQFADHALKDGGSMLVMVGGFKLDRIMDLMHHDKVRYHWLMAYAIRGIHASMYQYRINQTFKPILWYTKGRYTGEFINSMFDGSAPDLPMVMDTPALSQTPNHEYHKWGQDVQGFQWMVDKFASPGDTVCDPFLGGGTTAVAARERGCNFIGADVDPECILTTQTRLAEIHDTAIDMAA